MIVIIIIIITIIIIIIVILVIILIILVITKPIITILLIIIVIIIHTLEFPTLSPKSRHCGLNSVDRSGTSDAHRPLRSYQLLCMLLLCDCRCFCLCCFLLCLFLLMLLSVLLFLSILLIVYCRLPRGKLLFLTDCHKETNTSATYRLAALTIQSAKLHRITLL